MVLVSIYDSKAETYTPPHPSQSKATAIREFSTLVNDGGKSMISQNPEDFSMFLIGEWFDRVPLEDTDGASRMGAKLVSLPSFECIAHGIDLVKKD